ncbi:lactonase family protein [Mycobacterium sp. NPDC003449]
MIAIRTCVLCLTVVVALGCAAPAAGPPAVTIDRLVVLSDGDHLASTYADGVLAPVDRDRRDLLSTVSVRDGVVVTADVEVSNSVTAAPEVLALTPDGATAFVAERLGQRRPGDRLARDLPAGDRLFAVDLDDRQNPVLADIATIASAPEALAVHPDGSHIAVVSNPADTSVLQLVRWNADGFGAVEHFDLGGAVTATNVHWHPSGRALAVNLDGRDRVAFFTVDTSSPGRPELARWGEPVATGADPFVGRFSPDGRHYLTSDWGRDLTTTALEQRLPAGRSTLSVIRVGEPGVEQPRVVGGAESDKSAEGLAISPDGRWVATVNMRGTGVPAGSPAHDDHATVSLLRLDAETGQLTKIGDYRLDGVLPEGGTFDASGQYFVATVFGGPPGLQVYRLGPEDAPGLTAVQRIPLPHGVHHVVAG